MLIPKKSKVFDNLVKQSMVIIEAAEKFHSNVSGKKLKNDYAAMEMLESKADKSVHIITDDIEQSFILPLDKEDIKDLTEKMDDIVDNLEEVSNRLHIYKISETNQTLAEFSSLIVQSVKQIHQGILFVKDHKFASNEFSFCCERIHEIENKGDKLHRDVLRELIGNNSNINPKKILFIIKWKEIFQTLEDTLDKCEDISIIFGRLKTKYG